MACIRMRALPGLSQKMKLDYSSSFKVQQSYCSKILAARGQETTVILPVGEDAKAHSLPAGGRARTVSPNSARLIMCCRD
jgi:hypothetical protein